MVELVMFVYSFKASTAKFFSIIVLSVIAIITLITVIPSYDAPVVADYEAEKSISYSKIKTNEDRINFLSQFGWEVQETVKEEAEITIPGDFDTVYTSYNTLQMKQGLNLEKYKRKSAVRYTYIITNYPEYTGQVMANVIVYKNKVIGGDICSADVNGFVHGFSRDVTVS